MAWIVAIVVCVALFLLGRVLWRNWVRPWRDVEQLVADITHSRAPKTFLVDGNAAARHIGVALEGLFLWQRELAGRAQEGELNIRTILGAMRDGLAVVDADGRVRLLNRVVREMFAIADEQTDERLLATFRDGLLVETVTRTLRSGTIETASIIFGAGPVMRRFESP